MTDRKNRIALLIALAVVAGCLAAFLYARTTGPVCGSGTHPTRGKLGQSICCPNGALCD
jgi:hypothetical protein